MEPQIRLDGEALRANAVAWREHAGVPIRAVIKSNGYGWGFAALVRALDGAVAGYYVGDADEFERVRPLTRLPLATLAEVPAARVAAVLGADGIPTLCSPEALEAAHAWARSHETRARVRVALHNAIGWPGVRPADLVAFAALLATRALDVELSSHITDSALATAQLRAFDDARAAFAAAHVAVVATDLASSAPLAHGTAGAGRSMARVGAGLFGARFGGNVPLRSALAVRARIVETNEARGQHVGYGTVRAPHGGYLVTVRCGYGDGYPRVSAGAGGVLAVGMQYTTLHQSDRPPAETVDLVDRATDLDALAASAGIAVHQLVVALGSARGAGDRPGRDASER